MTEREDGAYFGILLFQIIDAHREAAECNRRQWARIWIVLWVSIGVLAFGAWYSVAQAQSVPAYEGCTLAWDYSEEDQAKIGGFGVFVGERRVTGLGPAERSIPCDALGLTFGETVLLKIRAWGINGGHSEWATLEAVYMPTPVVAPPTRVRLQWEWESSHGLPSPHRQAFQGRKADDPTGYDPAWIP